MSMPTGMQLSQIIVKALHESELRSKLLVAPKKTLHEMNVFIPEKQNVTVLESSEKQNFFVLPIMTNEDVEQLRASLTSVRPQRSIRSRILVKAFQDPEYKARLIADPKSVLIAEGMMISDSTTLTVLENNPQQLYIVLPNLHKSHEHNHGRVPSKA